MRLGWSVIVWVVLSGCEPENILSRAPYCALPGPCAGDEHCVNRYTSDATCDRGNCVVRYECLGDADCEPGETCEFRSTLAGGVGRYVCAAGCTSDEDCGLDRACAGGVCVSARTGCGPEGCPEGSGCANLAPGIDLCLPRCGRDRDCYGSPPRFDEPVQICLDGYCWNPPCVDGLDFGCGNGLECRNARPPPDLSP